MLHIFKLVSGEDVFALVREETETGFLLEDPCTVVFNPDNGVLMKHWMSLTLDNVAYLSKEHVLSDLGKANELAEYYYHTYMTEAKRVNKEALASYTKGFVQDDEEIEDDFFQYLTPGDKITYN